MPNAAYHNFHFDPYAQGAAAALWRYNDGVSAVASGNYLSFNNTGGVMYYDCGRGQFSFTINTDTGPSTGAVSQWGLRGSSGQLWFDITGTVFSAQASWEDGAYTYSLPLIWNTNWAGSDTVFSIYWKAGQAVFYANDIAIGVINDQSIPGGSMSPFINNPSSASFLLKSLSGKGLQSLWQTTASVSSDFGSGGGITTRDTIADTDVITNIQALAFVNVNDVIADTDAPTVKTFYDVNVHDTISDTDVITGIVG